MGFVDLGRTGWEWILLARHVRSLPVVLDAASSQSSNAEESEEGEKHTESVIPMEDHCILLHSDSSARGNLNRYLTFVQLRVDEETFGLHSEGAAGMSALYCYTLSSLQRSETMDLLHGRGEQKVP